MGTKVCKTTSTGMRQSRAGANTAEDRAEENKQQSVVLQFGATSILEINTLKLPTAYPVEAFSLVDLSPAGSGPRVYIYRGACAIQLEDSVVVTGGYAPKNTPFSEAPYKAFRRVQRYNLAGSLGRLPDLGHGRYDHTCGHYVQDGRVVRMLYRIVDSTSS